MKPDEQFSSEDYPVLRTPSCSPHQRPEEQLQEDEFCLKTNRSTKWKPHV